MPRRNNPKPTSSRPLPDYSICKSKKRFTNKLNAEKAAHMQNLKYSSLNITVYKCGQCGGWHLTRINK